MKDLSRFTEPHVDELFGYDAEEIEEKDPEELQREAWEEYRELSKAELKHEGAHLKKEFDRTFDMTEDSHPGASARRPNFGAKTTLLFHRIGVVKALLNWVGEPPSWEQVADEFGPPISPDEKNTRSDYIDAVTVVLENNPKGEFGKKTPIYKQVGRRYGYDQESRQRLFESCRKTFYRWNDEPQDEAQWRERVLT